MKKGGKKYSMGGKKCSMGGKKYSMGGKKYSMGGKKYSRGRGRGKGRARRGGMDGDITMVTRAEIDPWAQTMMTAYPDAQNFIRVLFDAVVAGRVSVVSVRNDANEEPTNITRDIYTRSAESGANAFQILAKNSVCKITDQADDLSYIGKFVGWPSNTMGSNFPFYMYFYK
jgi:hypothetical protein